MQRSSLLILLSAGSIFAGSWQDSASQGEKQKVNFCGLLRSTGNPTEAIKIENVGMPSYKRIQVYEKPADPTDPCVDPHKSSAELNFKDIAMIKQVAAPVIVQKERDRNDTGCNKPYTFKGRKYVEIEVKFNDMVTTKSFLVEDTRRIVYDEIVDGFLVKHKINIGALDSLEIKGSYETNEGETDKEIPGARCTMIISGQKPEPVVANPKLPKTTKESELKTIKIPVTNSGK